MGARPEGAAESVLAKDMSGAPPVVCSPPDGVGLFGDKGSPGLSWVFRAPPRGQKRAKTRAAAKRGQPSSWYGVAKGRGIRRSGREAGLPSVVEGVVN